MLKNFGFHSEQIVKYFDWRNKPFDLTFKRFTLAATWRKETGGKGDRQTSQKAIVIIQMRDDLECLSGFW